MREIRTRSLFYFYFMFLISSSCSLPSCQKQQVLQIVLSREEGNSWVHHYLQRLALTTSQQSSGRGGIGNIRQSSQSQSRDRSVGGPDDFSQTRGREPAVDLANVCSQSSFLVQISCRSAGILHWKRRSRQHPFSIPRSPCSYPSRST